VYGGSSKDIFTTFEIGAEIRKAYLNLELTTTTDKYDRKCIGRTIFHTGDVDKLYLYMKNNYKCLKYNIF
jgi:hypothetical protein